MDPKRSRETDEEDRVPQSLFQNVYVRRSASDFYFMELLISSSLCGINCTSLLPGRTSVDDGGVTYFTKKEIGEQFSKSYN